MTKTGNRPPKWLNTLGRSILPEEVQQGALEDFGAHYGNISESKGRLTAIIWYILNIVYILPAIIIEKLKWDSIMLKNYFLTAMRNFTRNKVYSVINISGLAAGLACCFFIIIFITDETNYDTFHTQAANIYRVVKKEIQNGLVEHSTSLPGPLAGAAATDFPEVIESVKMYRWYEAKKLSYGNKHFSIPDFVFTENSFFGLFDFELIQGDPENILSDPFTAVIRERIAEMYFGDQNPVGKELTDDLGNSFRITGVIKDTEKNSHIDFSILVSWSSQRYRWFDMWDVSLATTYLLLDNNAEPELLESKLPEFWKKYVPDDDNETSLMLQPLDRIHLYSGYINHNFERNPGNINYVYILTGIAVLILAIACINFTNLSAVRSMKRASEIGIRKAVGAKSTQLFRQFLSESVLMSMISFVLAMTAVYLYLPAISALTGKELSLLTDGSPGLIFIMFLIALVTGIISGIYPAMILSHFRPANVLKGSGSTVTSNKRIRTMLVIFQFSVTIILIICSFVIYNQLEYIRTSDMGFNKDQVLTTRISARDLRDVEVPLKEELHKIPAVKSISVSSFVMGEGGVTFTVRKHGAEDEMEWNVNAFHIDEQFIPLFDLKIVSGRNLTGMINSDIANSAIINESFAAKLGWDDPIDKMISMGGSVKRIVGVVGDFHFQSFRETINPVILLHDPQWISYVISIKINSSDFSAITERIKPVWERFFPGKPFEYSILDDQLNYLYEQDRKTGSLIGNFALMAILIACLGLFGLSSFNAARKTKEVAIRKVLGANRYEIFSIQFRELTMIIACSVLFSWPVAYSIMNLWLRQFAYRTHPGIGIYVAATISVLVLSLLTISYQIFKTIRINPAESLRHE